MKPRPFIPKRATPLWSVFFTFCFLLFTLSASAEVKLPYVFGNNMVLQQQTDAAIWGWTKAGSIVSVTPGWNKVKYTAKADASGKWKTTIATPSAGGPYDIVISDGTPLTLTNILIGEVWLCSGQSNMEMPMKGFKSQPVAGSNEAIVRSRNNHIRFITIPRWPATQPKENSKPAQWLEAAPQTVADFSATAYYFAQVVEQATGVPVGLVHVSYGGSPAEAWMNATTLQPFTDIKIPAVADSSKVNNRTATALFNGMLYPVIGYTIKGAIWYQGESNYDRPDQYINLFPAMVQSWRALWKQGDFPFYYAQIAPFNYAQLPPYNIGGKYNSAYIREAQLKSQGKIPNSGMAVLMDIGEEESIHPSHKKEGGERLAYWALAKTYDIKGLGYSSPTLDSMVVKGPVATLYFGNAGNGITSFGAPLKQFEIAGADKRFYPASATISRNTVIVSAPQVQTPVSVRYAFKDFVKGDLFSNEGLPVSSFRTDNWDMQTPVYTP